MSQPRAQLPAKLSDVGDLNLFLDGLTSTSLDLNSIEDAIRSIDAHLEENTSSLQASWVKFMDACNDIPKVSKSSSEWINAQEAVELLTDPQFVESNMCIPEPMAINCFLNNVIQALERNPGHEEMIFQDFVQFASEQGILLPAVSHVEEEEEENGPPGVSDHISDDDAKATSSLWKAIRQKFRRGLFCSMSKLPISTNPEVVLSSYSKRLEILQKLCFLFPGDVIWEGYKHQRSLQVEKLIALPESIRSLEVDFVVEIDGVPGDAIMLAKLSKAIAIMIHEDYALIEEEFVPPKILTLEYIHETYLSKFTRELNTVLQSHTDDYQEDPHDPLKLATSARRSISFRRGSGVSIFGNNLKMYKHCYLASLLLEVAVLQLMEQQEARGLYDLSGLRTGHQSHVQGPHSLAGSSKNERVTILGGNSTNMFACEDSLPPPFGHGPSHKPITGHHSSNTGQSLGSLWPWREEFKTFTSRISIAVAETIKKACDKSIEAENQQYQNNSKVPFVYIKEDLIGGKHDYPRCVTKGFSRFLETADEVLPLASSHGSKIFHVVRSSFVDSLETALKNWHARLFQIASDFPKTNRLDNMYLVLCNATFVRNHLAHYEIVIGSEPRRPFPVLHKQFSELVDRITEKIINYHEQIIITVVLQDAASHNWNDQRSFYEDERCSFSVQMWNYYLNGLQQDLWKYCPPRKAQEIFTSVLRSSISTLTFRLSRCTPSYNRTKQFRSDITAVLLCVLSYLWYASKSLDAILNPENRAVTFTNIHNLCSCLLANMVIVTCPLDVLCSKITKAQKNSEEEISGSRTNWLSFIYPEVFRNHEGSAVTLPDRQALYVVFKLMINQPVPRWPLVVQALLMRNARLPVTIVKYGDLSIIGTPDEETSQTCHKIGSSWFQDLSTSSKEVAGRMTSLVSSLYWLLYQCSHERTGLSSFLMALVHREDSWKMFDSAGSFKITSQAESPVWLNCIYETFDSVLKRLLQPSLLLLCENGTNVSKSYNFTSMSALPCGCPYSKPSRSNESRGQTEMVYQVLQQFIHNLTTNAVVLPRVICQFVNRLQETLHEKSIGMSGRTAGLKVLASNIYRWLLDNDRVSEVCGLNLSSATRKTIEVFAQVVWHVLVDLKQDGGIIDDPNLPTDLEFFINSKRDWFSSKVNQLKDFIANQSYEEYKVESVHQEVAETKFTNTALMLVKDPKSYSALKHVYSFLSSNKDWLMNFILVPSHVLPPSPSTKYENPLKGEQSFSFNSLRQYSMIGEWAFDQEKIATFPYDWEKLLQSNLGLSEPAMQRLVLNRFEMQEGAYLDEAEKEMVHLLKTFYGMSSEDETERCQDN